VQGKTFWRCIALYSLGCAVLLQVCKLINNSNSKNNGNTIYDSMPTYKCNNALCIASECAVPPSFGEDKSSML